jgi:hypothetical protein
VKNFGNLLDHGPAWGSFTIYPARFGVTRYRLVVFPPGITIAHRRMLKLWRAWPMWGAALWVVLQIGGSLVDMPETALLGGSMLVIATGAMTFVLAGETRLQVRSLWGVSMAGYRSPEVDERCTLLRVLARNLDRADMDLGEGRISPAEYETRCWRAYDALDELPALADPARAV